jgi:hypothetical protein
MFRLQVIINSPTVPSSNGNTMISIAAVVLAVIPSCVTAYFVWKKYQSVLFTVFGFFATMIFICLFYIFIYLLMNTK